MYTTCGERIRTDRLVLQGALPHLEAPTRLSISHLYHLTALLSPGSRPLFCVGSFGPVQAQRHQNVFCASYTVQKADSDADSDADADADAECVFVDKLHLSQLPGKHLGHLF